MTILQLDRKIGSGYEHSALCAGVVRSVIKGHKENLSAFLSITDVEYCGTLVDIWAQEIGEEPFFRFYGNAKDCPDIPEVVAFLLSK